MPNRRPRLVLAVATLALLVVLGAFAVAIVRSQSDEREDARGRFEERAAVTAALTESLFAASTQTSGEELSQLFGGPTVDERLLAERAEEARTRVVMVVGEDGDVHGSTTGSALSEQLAALPVVDQVLENGGYALSDYVEGAAGGGTDGLVYALAFDAGERRRAFVQTFDGALLSAFFGGYLAGIPGADVTDPYIVDSEGRVIATAVRGQAAGEPVAEPGLLGALAEGPGGTFESDDGEHTFTTSTLDNSTWRILLAERSADLYSGISPVVEWLILIALGIAGLFALGSLYRTMHAAIEVQEANERLEEANAELARSNLELQRSNGELEQFASVASHDLQEPLRKVQTFGDQLERRFGDEIPVEGLDYLRRMRKAAQRMSVLIDDLLRFSRVTTRALPPEPVDLGRVTREVVSDLETAIAEAHAEVHVGPMPMVEADPGQMRQLLQNLIANAIKFVRPGIAPVVNVEQVAAPAGFAALAVRDNGIGIEAEYQERVFRVFERLHPRDVYEGTGIGLALCRKIAERHGGSIEVDSTPGEGSTFLVTLPLHVATGNGRRPDTAKPAGTAAERSPAGV